MPRVRKLMKGRAALKASEPTDPAEAAKNDYNAYLQEEEARRKREEALKARLQQRLEDQQRLSKLNRVKVQDNWRRIMRLAKLEELKASIEVLAQTHEREVDRKDTIINMLHHDLNEAEEQYQMALRAHLQMVDEMTALQRTRLEQLQVEFEQGVEILKNEFSTERSSIVEQNNREREELTQVLLTMERDYADTEEKSQQEFETTKKEIQDNNMQEYNLLRTELQQHIDDLEHHFESAHSNYIKQNDHRQEQFKLMMMRDDDASKMIKRQQAKIHRFQENINLWRSKLQNNVRECEERNKALKEEKEVVQKHFQGLKARMVRFRDGQHKRLTHLTVVAEKCSKELQSKLDKAEKILRLVEMNRKLETEREKVMPFYKSTTEDPASEPVEEGEQWGYLDRFFKRMNKVVLDKMALSKEREMLQRENEDLRAILKQYLDGITINEDALAGNNPLLIVNQRSNAVLPRPIEQARPVVIEASQARRYL